MGIKRVVDMDFWTDDKVIENFSPEDKLFFLYLLTNPHSSMLGVYKISPKQMAFEIGYSQEAVSVLIDRFENKYGMIKYSSSTREMAIKNYLRFGIVSGGKPVLDRLCSSMKEVKDITLLQFVLESIEKRPPDNNTIKNFIEILNEYVYGNENEDGNGDGDGDGESYPESYDDSYHDSSAPASLPPPFQTVIDLYQYYCRSYPDETELTEARKTAIGKILKQYTMDDVAAAFRKAEASKFLRGVNNTGWKASLDWMLDVDNMKKILSGKYDDHQQGSGSGRNNAFNTYQKRNDIDYEVIERMAQAKLFPPKTAGEDPELMARVEEMQRRLAN